MAKGSIAKPIVAKKILEVFPGSFEYNGGKEIRIPMTENGEVIQIKVALTAAKENVESGMDVAMPGDFPPPANAEPTAARTEPVAPTADEKAAVANLLKQLGL